VLPLAPVHLTTMSGRRPGQLPGLLLHDFSGTLSTEFCELVDDARERLGGVEFVGAGSPQKRLDVGQVAQDELPLSRALAVGLGGPALDAAEEHLGGSTQQGDRVEAIIEAALVETVPETCKDGPSSRARSCVIRSSRHTYPPSASDHSLQPPKSVSTTRNPSLPSSASALDFPVPDIPVTRIFRIVARLSDGANNFPLRARPDSGIRAGSTRSLRPSDQGV
jgi:hypothetical protein